MEESDSMNFSVFVRSLQPVRKFRRGLAKSVSFFITCFTKIMLQRTGKVFIDKIAGLWYIIYLKRGIYPLLELDIIKAKALQKNIPQILLHIKMFCIFKPSL
jgi:hypothetical protein